MKNRKIHWNAHVPLGMDGQKTKDRMAALLGVGIGCSFQFLIRYFSARSNLWGYINGKYQRMPGAMMPPFGELMDGVFLGLAIVALGYGVIAVLMYLYHYQGCRSIYTMRRLPDRWELWRRCLTLPVMFLALSAVSALVLTGLYNLLWRYATPMDALPL